MLIRFTTYDSGKAKHVDVNSDAPPALEGAVELAGVLYRAYEITHHVNPPEEPRMRHYVSVKLALK